MIENHIILPYVIAILAMLGISTIIYTLSKKFHFPFAVGLLLTGLFISLFDTMVLYFGEILTSEVLINYGNHLRTFGLVNFIKFSPDIVFYVFLPSLIFESAYHLNYRTFRHVIPEVAVLSTLGLCLSTSIIGFLVHWLLSIPLDVSLLFGALISATDPVAVLAIFKDLRVPRKLSTIVDGESLINDGTALILFQILLVGIGEKTFTKTIGFSFFALQGIHLLQSIILAIIIGCIFGWVFSYTIGHSKNKGVQLTLSLILAHVTFITSETMFNASGILATMVAGIIVGNFGKRKMDKKSQYSFKDIWEFLGFISNSLIFLLLGAKLGQTDIHYWGVMILVSLIVIFLARPVSVFLSFLITNRFRCKETQIGYKDQIITVWGGLRGALAAGAVLLIPEGFEYASLLQAITAGVIFMSFMINAMSMKRLLKTLGYGRYTINEHLQFYEAQILINEKISQVLEHLKEKDYLPPNTYNYLKNQYDAKLEISTIGLNTLRKQFANYDRETEIILTHYALGIELRSYRKLWGYREISEERFSTLLASIHRQIARLERDELPDERRSSPKIAPPIPDNLPFLWIKWEVPRKVIDHWFYQYREQKIVHRWEHYRARSIASHKVVRDFSYLHEDHEMFQDSRIVKKILKRYKEWHLSAIKKMAILEKQYPELIIPAQLKLGERICLQKEQIIEREFLRKGFISDKIFHDLEDEIAHRAKQKTPEPFSL